MDLRDNPGGLLAQAIEKVAGPANPAGHAKATHQRAREHTAQETLRYSLIGTRAK